MPQACASDRPRVTPRPVRLGAATERPVRRERASARAARSVGHVLRATHRRRVQAGPVTTHRRRRASGASMARRATLRANARAPRVQRVAACVFVSSLTVESAVIRASREAIVTPAAPGAARLAACAYPSPPPTSACRRARLRTVVRATVAWATRASLSPTRQPCRPCRSGSASPSVERTRTAARGLATRCRATAADQRVSGRFGGPLIRRFVES